MQWIVMLIIVHVITLHHHTIYHIIGEGGGRWGRRKFWKGDHYFSVAVCFWWKSPLLYSTYAKFLFHIKFSKLNLLAQRKIGNFYLKHLFRCSLIFQPLNQNQNMWVLWTQIIFSQYYMPLSFESHQVSLVISNSNNRWILIWLLGRKGKISILDPRFT